MKNDLLPLGSVVYINNGSKQLVIVGYGFKNDKGEMFDYLGFPYPEGFLSKDMNYLFNNSNIREVTFKGYSDEKFNLVNNALENLLHKGGE